MSFTIGHEWTDDLEREIAGIASDVAPLAWYRQQVESGALSTFHAYAGFERVGCVMWRIDHQPNGKELVIVAAVGWHRDFDLTASILPRLEKMGEAMGCATVRMHTRRSGMVAVLARCGYGQAEYVMRRRLA
jgi:hypothetical protein